jgi:hypothetical protein
MPLPLCLNQSDTPGSVHYITPDPAKVQGFLTQHPHVEELLHDAQRPLQHAFGKDVTVSVTVVNNPDIAPGEVLVSSIQTSLSAMKALARLDAFDEEWWLDNAPRAKRRLVFTLAFPA